MEQKTEASQAVDLPFPPMPRPVVIHTILGDLFDFFTMQQYAMRYADLVVAALKAQPAPTEAAQGDAIKARVKELQKQGLPLHDDVVLQQLSGNSGELHPSGNTGELAQGWDVDDLISDMDINEEVAGMRAELQASSTIIPSILAAQGEDSARLDWLIENVSSGSIGFINGDFIGSQDFDELKVYIDRARASAETGGVSRADLAKLLSDANPGDAT